MRNEAEPLHGNFLLREGLFEDFFPHLALANEDVAEEIVESSHCRVRVDDHPLLEHDAHGLALALEREQTGLTLHPDELKDIGEREIFQGA